MLEERPHEVVVAPEPETPKEPEAPEAPKAADPYEAIDEQYRDVCRDNDELLDGLDPLDRLRVTEVARRAEQLVAAGAITKDQLLGTAQPSPTTPVEPTKAKAKPKEQESKNTTDERLARLETLMLQDREERQQKEQTEQNRQREDRFMGAISTGLDDSEITNEGLREALTDEFVGKFWRMKNKPSPDGYDRAVKKFLKDKIDAAAEQQVEQKGDYLLGKLAQRQATNTETRSAGAAPAKDVIKLTPEQARDPMKVAQAIKEKRGLA